MVEQGFRKRNESKLVYTGTLKILHKRAESDFKIEQRGLHYDKILY